MNEYISNEIAKNIKGMSETIGKDESKYWYFAGKVEALSLLKKEMENQIKIEESYNNYREALFQQRMKDKINHTYGRKGSGVVIDERW